MWLKNLWWAWVLAGLLVIMARKVRRRAVRAASVAIHTAFGTQILLGIAVVMSGMEM